MNFDYKLHTGIDLFVEGRISYSDAKRQERTARAVLENLKKYPGQIIADEVGMGKTFVALAVASSIAIAEDRPIVIMIPANLKSKWPRDYKRFLEFCVPEDMQKRLKFGVAENGVQFLKYLDDPPERRKSIVFMTHGSLTRTLSDGWVKLAIIQRAIRGRHNTKAIRKILYRFLGDLLFMRWIATKHTDIWEKLLKTHPSKWLKLLLKHSIDPENDNNVETDDDPVPESVIKALEKMRSKDLQEIYNALDQIPRRKTKHFNTHLKKAREIINKKVKNVWYSSMQNIDYKLPLLILDEAHHLKNSHTRLASLFHSNEALEDSNSYSKDGQLANVFERMLFLTATPFQLGHNELCSVLDRFKGITWQESTMPRGGLKSYQKLLDDLRKNLDSAQFSAVSFDGAWGKLKYADLFIDGIEYDQKDNDKWWVAMMRSVNRSNTQLQAFNRYKECKDKMGEAEKLLKKMVIRHLKSKVFPDTDIYRRSRLIGNDIINDKPNNENHVEGLQVKGESLLPFLLAARMAVKSGNQRSFFAEGLASSYEAFMKTTALDKVKDNVDTDDDIESDSLKIIKNERDSWYLDNISKQFSKRRKADHPKIGATVNKAINLWNSGEKVLIFCHYIQTGRALRQYISDAIKSQIIKEGVKKMKCPQADVLDKLNDIGKRFFNEESSFMMAFSDKMFQLLKEVDNFSEEDKQKLISVIQRFLRTPSFLVRFFPINQHIFSADTVSKAFNKTDSSGLSLEGLIKNFIQFIDKNCNAHERQEYLDSLSDISTGDIRAEDVDESEYSNFSPIVRLVNGSTKQSARQTLMLTFNTPFFPEILVASSVMAEGVDLQLNCRYIIHHDLCWNPSTLEQRTGRIDRIGAKAELCGQSINIFLPFIAETQDEKMYRVVIDRERWFNIVMGEKFKIDVSSTDKLAERLILPEKIINELQFKLECKL
jgi:superfamily II DNA or RNA helicase